MAVVTRSSQQCVKAHHAVILLRYSHNQSFNVGPVYVPCSWSVTGCFNVM